jgi:hypothetical protein
MNLKTVSTKLNYILSPLNTNIASYYIACIDRNVTLLFNLTKKHEKI